MPLPEGFGISASLKAWALERGFDRLDEHLEHFVGYARANGKRYADWDQALMNAIRADWAGVRRLPGGKRTPQNYTTKMAAHSAERARSSSRITNDDDEFQHRNYGEGLNDDGTF